VADVRGATPRVAPRRGGHRSRARATGADSPELDGELLRLDRLAGVGMLAAEVAHEVRNALTAVKTFLALLPDGEGAAELSGLRAVAVDEVGRIERLVDLLLEQAQPPVSSAMAGGTSAAGGSCDTAEAVRAVARLVERRATAAGVRLESDLPTALPPAPIGEDALRQVLLNLVLNAIDATPHGGDVRLAARAIGPALELVVEDRGAGVSADLRRRIFEPFFSTREGRTGGLGLAIARRLVEEAGGTIAVNDRSEGGSRFRVRLPRPRATP
jgi:signal transduction histidine kinase